MSLRINPTIWDVWPRTYGLHQNDKDILSVLALPILYDAPLIANSTTEAATISFSDWDQEYDYGMGHVDLYKVCYGPSGTPLSSSTDEITDTEVTIHYLLADTSYDFAVACLSYIDGFLTEGPVSEILTASTKCEGKFNYLFF